MLLAVAVLTAGQAWALQGGRVTFVYAAEHGTAVASEANGKVTITISPDEGWRAIDGDVTAVATVANSNVAEARRAEAAEDESIGLGGEAIAVTCTATNVFTLTLPTDENKNVRVTVNFSERLSFTPTVSITGWTFNGYDATANAPTVSGNTSGGAVTYTYADTENGTYTATVPTAAGTHYVKATIAATADYNAATATAAFAIAEKETAQVSYINAKGVLCDGADGHPAKATAYVLDGSETTLGTADATTWYVCNSDLTYAKGLVIDGEVHLILADDVTMNVPPIFGELEEADSSPEEASSIYGMSSMTIYGQAKGTGVLNTTFSIIVGDFTINGGNVISGGVINSDLPICIATMGDFIVNGGSVTTDPEMPIGIMTMGCFIVNGGTVIAECTGESVAGIWVLGATINGGTVRTRGTFGIMYLEMGSSRAYKDVYASRSMNIPSANEQFGRITINGGKVTAIGDEENKGAGIFAGYDITLGWTNADDFILASSYISEYGDVKVAEGKKLMDEDGNLYEGELDDEALSAIAGKKLTSDQVVKFAFAEGQTWMTWCSSKAYKLPDGLTAYTVSGLSEDGKSVVLTPAETIMADTPLLLKGTAGTTYTALWNATDFVYTTGLVSKPVGNVLTFYGNPTDATISSGYTYEFGKTYVLYQGEFVLVDSDAGLLAHKCLLTLTTAAARQLTMSIGDETTGITTTNCTNSTNSEEAWYGIDGRKLQSKPATKGLYIYKGKKRIVR